MPDVIKILWAIVGTLVVLTFCFGVAAILIPDFRDSAATAALIAAILGPLTTAASILGGVVLSKGVKQAIQEETQQVQDPQGKAEGSGNGA